MSNYDKNELLALIKDYGNLENIYNNSDIQSDGFGTYFWDIKDKLFEKIEEIISKLNFIKEKI